VVFVRDFYSKNSLPRPTLQAIHRPPTPQVQSTSRGSDGASDDNGDRRFDIIIIYYKDRGAKNPRETTAEQRLTVERSFLADVPKNIYEKTIKSSLPALPPQTVVGGASNARDRHTMMMIIILLLCGDSLRTDDVLLSKCQVA